MATKKELWAIVAPLIKKKVSNKSKVIKKKYKPKLKELSPLINFNYKPKPIKYTLRKSIKKLNVKKIKQNYILWHSFYEVKKHLVSSKKKKYRLKLALKKNRLEQILTFILKKKIEIKLKDIIRGGKNSLKIKKSYKLICKKLKYKKEFKFYKQLKETISILTLGLFFNNCLLISNLFARTINMIPFKFLKRTLKSFMDILTTTHATITPYNSIRLNISGKFKGKARRSNMIYFKRGKQFTYKTMNFNQFNYTVDYIRTSAGVFGLKIWCN